MPQDPIQVAATAAQGFKLYQCDKCADNVQKALIAAGLHGDRIELRAKLGALFIVCLSYDGGNASITLNGRHVAIRVGNMVFDNLHSAGMTFDDWLRDFLAPAGVSIVQVDPF